MTAIQTDVPRGLFPSSVVERAFPGIKGQERKSGREKARRSGCCSLRLVRSDRRVAYNRGIYLIITALAHCGECHAPRNFLGAARSGQRLAGTPDGPDGQLVPNITPDPDTGIGKWEKEDVVELLKTGMTPEQSRVKSAMRETIDDGLKYLSDSDLQAIADYLFAQPPIVTT